MLADSLRVNLGFRDQLYRHSVLQVLNVVSEALTKLPAKHAYKTFNSHWGYVADGENFSCDMINFEEKRVRRLTFTFFLNWGWQKP